MGKWGLKHEMDKGPVLYTWRKRVNRHFAKRSINGWHTRKQCTVIRRQNKSKQNLFGLVKWKIWASIIIPNVGNGNGFFHKIWWEYSFGTILFWRMIKKHLSRTLRKLTVVFLLTKNSTLRKRGPAILLDEDRCV